MRSTIDISQPEIEKAHLPAAIEANDKIEEKVLKEVKEEKNEETIEKPKEIERATSRHEVNNEISKKKKGESVKEKLKAYPWHHKGITIKKVIEAIKPDYYNKQ